MGNKYLEKCAAMGMVSSAIGAVGTLGKNVVKGVGNQFHLATGGGLHNRATSMFGHKNPSDILNFTDSFSGKRKILAAMQGRTATLKPGMTRGTVGSTTFSNSPTGIKEPNRVLHNERNAARLASGLIVGGSIYGGKKLLSNNSNQTSYPQYYQ